MAVTEKIRVKRRCQRDPVYHIEEVQGVLSLEEYQKRVARAVAKHDRVAVAACHDVGKTFLMAKLVLWLGSAFPGCKIITTAPTFNQVKRLLWSEIRSGFNRSRYPLGGTMLTTEWKLGDDWFAVGFTSRAEASSGDAQGGSSFQGFHAKYVFLVFDEATGIPPAIWTQAEGMMTSGNVKFVAIGNPTTRNCRFYNCFTSPSWYKVRLNCFDSPNFKANGITNLEKLRAELDVLRELSEADRLARLRSYKVVQVKLLTVKWVLEMALEWGVDHPLFVSKCLGQFPEDDDSVLMPLGLVEMAQRRASLPANEKDPDHRRISIGVDVARFGSDKSILTKIDGTRTTERRVLVKRDTMEVTGNVIDMLSTCNSIDVRVVIDGTGIGAGVVDALRQAQNEGLIPSHVQIIEVHFGSTRFCETDTDAGKEKQAQEAKKYANLKAKMFVLLAQDLKSKLALLENETVYSGELPTIKYRFDSKGRWVIESKDEYRKRTGLSSPDSADSLALANLGRYDSLEVGKFTEEMTQPGQRGIAAGLGTGDQW